MLGKEQVRSTGDVIIIAIKYAPWRNTDVNITQLCRAFPKREMAKTPH